MASLHRYRDESPDLLPGRPCPECGSTKGYEPIGPFRVRCDECDALLKNPKVLDA